MFPPIAPEAVTAIRKRLRYRQPAFAALLNVSPSYVSQIERGAKIPDRATLALLHALSVPGVVEHLSTFAEEGAGDERETA